jgi:hypothetical protein
MNATIDELPEYRETSLEDELPEYRETSLEDELPEYRETSLEDELLSVFEKMGMKNEGVELVDLIKIMPSRYVNDERPIVRDYATSLFKPEPEPTIESLTEICNELRRAFKEGNERLSCLERVVRDIVIADLRDRGTSSLSRASTTKDWRAVEFFIKCGADMQSLSSNDYIAYRNANLPKLMQKYKLTQSVMDQRNCENPWRCNAELFRNWIHETPHTGFDDNNPTFVSYFNY